MTRASLVLSLLFLFNSSPSTDVVGYECHAFERRMVEVPPHPGCAPPCFVMTMPAPIPCTVVPSGFPDREWEAHVADIPLGRVVYGCVEAIDDDPPLRSECIGWSDPVPPAPVRRGAPMQVTP